jgi:hypothetical protein
MNGISAFAFFCEDIRREASGKETFIGVMADVMTFPAFPAHVRRLQVYFRMRFDVGWSYDQNITPALELDGNIVEAEGTKTDPIPLNMIKQSIIRAEKRKLPFITIGGRVRLKEPFPVQSPGQLLAILNVGDEKRLCGALAFSQRPTPSTEP